MPAPTLGLINDGDTRAGSAAAGNTHMGSSSSTYSFPAALGNGPIVEVFPDVFACEGKFVLLPGATILRNMTILRKGTELCIINSVRLMPEQEAELDKLGTVKHVVRICPGHGADDPYYVAKYKATMWALKGLQYPPETNLKVDKELGKEVPFPDLMEVIEFENLSAKAKAKGGDGVMLIKKEKGILVGSDSLHNYGEHDHQLSDLKRSWLANFLCWMLGFDGRCSTPPIFFAVTSSNGKPSGMKPDFDRLKALEFDALIPPHGTVVKSGAKQAFLDSNAKINWTK